VKLNTYNEGDNIFQLQTAWGLKLENYGTTMLSHSVQQKTLGIVHFHNGKSQKSIALIMLY